MKLGARILKTGLAVMLSIYVSMLLELDPVVFAAIASVLTIQPSVYRSWKYMLEQVQANIIGALMAITAIYAFGSEPWVVGFVVMLAIAINLKLGFKDSVTMVVLTVIAIMEVSDKNIILFAINRFSLIMIGVLSSMLINIIFMPPKYANKLMAEIRKTNEKMSSFLRFITDVEVDEKAMKEEREEIKKSIEKVEKLSKLHREERHNRLFRKKYSKSKQTVILKQFVNVTNKTYTIIEALERHHIGSIKYPDELKDDIQDHLKKVIEYKEKIVLKFDGKIKVTQVHRKEMEIEESSDLLVRKIISCSSVEAEEKEWMHALPIISSIVELTQELDRLEKMIDNLRLYNKNEK